MQRIAFGVVLGAMLAASGTVMAQAPSWTPPPENQRCPSKWGAGDERGSANHMKPQTVLNAVKLIKTGEDGRIQLIKKRKPRQASARRKTR